MGYGLADNLKEFSHKPEAVSGGVEKCGNVAGCLNLASSQHQGTQ